MNATPSLIDRLSFYALLVLASGLFWLSPHPPLLDLPQHAAQIAGLRDMMRGEFRWSELAEFQLLTPYYLSYGTGALLALIMPVHAALSLTLNLAFLAFIWGCIKLRRLFDGDFRLDVLFIPGFFSFSWQIGLTSYLIAVPLALFFIAFAIEHLRDSTLRSGLKMACMGIALFLSHALAAMYGGIFAGLYLLLHARRLPQLIKLSWPLIPMAVLFVFYYLTKNDVMNSGLSFILDLSWARFTQLIQGQIWTCIALDPTSSLIDLGLSLSITFIICLPALISRFEGNQEGSRIVLFAIACLILLLMPIRLLNVDLMNQRISPFLLPFFLLMFGHNPSFPSRNFLRWAPHFFCAALILLNAVLIEKFDVERKSFDAVMEKMEPNQRVLYIPFYKESLGINKMHVYRYFAVWYQVEKGGWVDFNFATNPPHLIKFRPQNAPPLGEDFVLKPYFNWDTMKAWNYRYILLRIPPGETLEKTTARLAGGPCKVSLVIQLDLWRLYERGACSSKVIDNH